MADNPALQFSIVLATVPEVRLAEEISVGLVTAKLAACVSQIPHVSSHYFWEGKLEREAEILLIVKTRAALVANVSQFIKEKHPAQVPEIISVPITDGHRPYIEWIGANTRVSRPMEDVNFSE